MHGIREACEGYKSVGRKTSQVRGYFARYLSSTLLLSGKSVEEGPAINV
jgi:hypothetical protein